MGGINYGCIEWWFWVVSKVSKNNNRNILLKSIDSTLVPTNIMSYKNVILNKSWKTIIFKSDTGATGNYIRGQDTIILNNPGPTATGPRVRLPNNSIIQTKTFWIYTSPNVTINSHTISCISKLKEHQPSLNKKTVWFKLLRAVHNKDVTIFNSDKNPVLNEISNTLYGLWVVTIDTS